MVTANLQRRFVNFAATIWDETVIISTIDLHVMVASGHAASSRGLLTLIGEGGVARFLGFCGGVGSLVGAYFLRCVVNSAPPRRALSLLVRVLVPNIIGTGARCGWRSNPVTVSRLVASPARWSGPRALPRALALLEWKSSRPRLALASRSVPPARRARGSHSDWIERPDIATAKILAFLLLAVLFFFFFVCVWAFEMELGKVGIVLLFFIVRVGVNAACCGGRLY
ncbi:hypothetical protein NL676_019624 [Syzygium grande]|nr:hypothetical protein NL676_019624 [Syzygium grande]